MKKFNIVLFEPEIPQNTGNIARLCACTGTNLFLIGKLGFSLSDKYTKRAGLDYWENVNLEKFDTLEELQNQYKDANFYYLTTKSKKSFFDVEFKEGDFLVFGPETRGLPEKLLKENQINAVTIPMLENQRSLNLSNSVAIVLYEAIRQNRLKAKSKMWNVI
ncbi:MAG: tRNA (uridine(34)/cytosine(34)/5-carboxymethylaminomethyluridine(34)-2'-O)-methyltransferase TrmL [Candidatus Gastranaerophilales bacterium]|nr:tRNA (uridine(34)/cytosine(34)/5-carboxymethylaminomethyluridine(34)-2'-O)-methyltransferase TrmL [Candidatus Gastranaerophilales bacterium]